MIRTAIVAAPIDVPGLLAEVTSDATGATTCFVGTVRNVHEGRAVTGIEYSAYTAMAIDEMTRIATEARAQFGDVRIVIEHRVGALVLQDVSVAIAVSHAHRAPALDAQRFTIEELKRRVPVWKCEHYADGERRWVDPTAAAPTAAGAPDVGT
jgi:molybdopterin synthase catalytic subunit